MPAARAQRGLATACLWLLAILAVSLAKLAASAASAPAAPSHGHHLARRGPHGRHGSHARSKRARRAIVGGVPIAIAQAPWQVEIEVEDEGISRLCGGSIVDASHILTAAHCVLNQTNSEPLAPEDFTVRAGTSDIFAFAEGGQTRAVTGVRAHPYYTYVSDSDADDVALLTLGKSLTLGSTATPISLTPPGPGPPEGSRVDLRLRRGEPGHRRTEWQAVLAQPDGGLQPLMRWERQCGGALRQRPVGLSLQR
jgi:Trypsin